MHPTPDGRGMTSWVGEVAGPGPNVVAVEFVPVGGGASERMRYYDRATLLPRVWRLGDENVPSLAGHRFLPAPRQRRGGARDVRDVYAAGHRLLRRASK
jgi:hypothetical protein